MMDRLAAFHGVIPTKLAAGVRVEDLPVRRYDASKAQRQLGLVFTPFATSMTDMAHFLVEHGMVQPPAKL